MKAIKGLSKVKFKAWLQQFDHCTVVGQSDSIACPVHCYLENVFPNASILLVTKEDIRIDDTVYEQPSWVAKFIAKIDEYPKAFVTASHALAVLKTV